MKNKVLFFSIDRLGDYFIRSNVIFNITKYYKSSEIVCSNLNNKLINKQSFFDKIYVFDTSKKNINKIKYIINFFYKKYDSVICFDGKNISNIWSETYDRDLTGKNIFKLQDEIIKQIINELVGAGAVLSKDINKKIASSSTDDISIYECINFARGAVTPTLNPKAIEVVENLSENSKKIVFLSNAPRPSSKVIEFLRRMKMSEKFLSKVITSGEAAMHAINQNKFGKKFYHLGPSRDQSIFEKLSKNRTSLDGCDFILCTGLFEEHEKD